jgi:ATP-binding cassette subfamily B protein
MLPFYISVVKNYFERKKLTVGTLHIFFMYINILIWPFSMVGWVYHLVNQRSAASLTRVNEFVGQKSEIVQQKFGPI